MKGREFIGPVNEKGMLPRATALAIQALLGDLRGKTVKVVIAPFHAKRSQSQNGYYWAVVVPAWRQIFRDAGEIMTDDEVHAFLVQHVGKLTKTIVHPNGSIKVIIRSTGDLDTKEFTEFLEICRLIAGEYGHDIPPPTKEIENGKQN